MSDLSTGTEDNTAMKDNATSLGVDSSVVLAASAHGAPDGGLDGYMVTVPITRPTGRTVLLTKLVTQIPSANPDESTHLHVPYNCYTKCTIQAYT